MFASLCRFLNSPHPANTSYKVAFYSAVAISVFVALFLVAFQPFGISRIQSPYRLLIIASYGLPCFPPDLVLGFGLVFWFRHTDWGERWKVWHVLVGILMHILIIGASNYWYDCLLIKRSFCASGLLDMEINTALLGVFPAFGTFISARMFLVNKNQAAAQSLNASIVAAPRPEAEQTAPAAAVALKICGENRDECVKANLDQLCYMKSDGNYVEIVLAASSGRPGTRLLRAALKDIEAQIAAQTGAVVRCHRSYLVNRQRVASAEGNALGLVLTLDRNGLQVPVSRSFVAQFRA